MFNKILTLICFFSLAFTYTISAQTEVEYDTELTITTEPGNCIVVSDCTDLQTEYVITDLDQTDGSGARVVGVSQTNSFSLGAYVDSGNHFAVTPICYRLETIQALVDVINTSDNCCLVVDAVSSGLCQLIRDALPDGNSVQNFSDVLGIVELFGQSSPSLESFVEFITLLNDNIGTLQIVCPGTEEFAYCLDLENQELYNVMGTAVEPLLGDAVTSMAIAPNPAKDFLTLEINNNKLTDVSIEVNNLSGQIIIEEDFLLSPGMNYFTKDISMLKPGVYFVNLRKDNKISTTKLVVQ